MAAIRFDTLKYANRLKAAGAEPKIAEAEAEALAEVFELNLNEVATRDDLKHMEERLNERLETRLLQLEQRHDYQIRRVNGCSNRSSCYVSKDFIAIRRLNL